MCSHDSKVELWLRAFLFSEVQKYKKFREGHSSWAMRAVFRNRSFCRIHSLVTDFKKIYSFKKYLRRYCLMECAAIVCMDGAFLFIFWWRGEGVERVPRLRDRRPSTTTCPACLVIWTRNSNSVQWGKKLFVLSRLGQPRRNKILMYRHDNFCAKFCFMSYLFWRFVSCNQIAYHQSRKWNIVYLSTVLTGRSGRDCGCPACLGSPLDSLYGVPFMRWTLYQKCSKNLWVVKRDGKIDNLFYSASTVKSPALQQL